MYSKIQTTTSIRNYSGQIDLLKEELRHADAVIIGAGAGLSAAAGMTYSGERFERYFSDFHKRYGITDMYSGGFYPYETPEEYWAWWSRHIYYNRYDMPQNDLFHDLLDIVKDKNYFVLTTNVDHLFQLNGFDKNRLFYTQGDYGLWQCSKACHNKTYDNEETVRKMLAEQKNMKIPSELIPHCPVCGAPMAMNLRCDNYFVEDDGWHAAKKRYEDFIHQHEGSHILLLELGVGGNTPAIIKYPFWRMTAENKNAIYVCINQGEAVCPEEIDKQSICVDENINTVIAQLH